MEAQHFLALGKPCPWARHQLKKGHHRLGHQVVIGFDQMGLAHVYDFANAEMQWRPGYLSW